MKMDFLALRNRITETLSDIEIVVDRSELLLDKAVTNNDDGYLDGVALNLHGFYAGVERIFEDIARTVEQSVPTGPNWHQSLLLQMSADSGDIRPAVIGRETRRCLDEYRGFRHVVRNVYAFNLNASRLKEMTNQLRNCFHALGSDLEKFGGFLSRMVNPEMGANNEKD